MIIICKFNRQNKKQIASFSSKNNLAERNFYQESNSLKGRPEIAIEVINYSKNFGKGKKGMLVTH